MSCEHEWVRISDASAQCSLCGELLLMVHPANVPFIEGAAERGSERAQRLLGEMRPWPFPEDF